MIANTHAEWLEGDVAFGSEDSTARRPERCGVLGVEVAIQAHFSISARPRRSLAHFTGGHCGQAVLLRTQHTGDGLQTRGALAEDVSRQLR